MIELVWGGIILPVCFMGIANRSYRAVIEPAQSYYAEHAEIYETLNQYTSSQYIVLKVITFMSRQSEPE